MLGWPPPFEKFRKIPRLFRDVVVTEKIDGTNAVVVVPADPTLPVVFGSRNRWISPGKGTDNYDFADWGTRNADQLREALGPGWHHGEWFGAGIARKYGLTERRWALFNSSVFQVDPHTGLTHKHGNGTRNPTALPSNVTVVPVLHRGPMTDQTIAQAIADLRQHGSYVVPFMNPEGIVVCHLASGQLFKFTLDGDAVKGPDRQSPEEV